MDLLGMVKGQLTDAVMEKLGGAVGLGTGDVSKAMGAIIPTQLSAIANLGSSPTGAQNLIGMASQFANVGNIGNLLGQANGIGGLMDMGKNILPMLFGGNVDKVVQGVASHTGIGSNAISGLMTMAGPMVMGILGNQIKTQGLNPMGLVSMLGGLKGQLDGVLPAGLKDIAGLGGLAAGALGATGAVGGLAGQAGNIAGGLAGQAGNLAGQAGNMANDALRGAGGLAGQAVNAAKVAAPAARGGLPGWLLPLVGVLALGGIGWALLGRGQAPATATTPPAATTTDSSAATPPATTDSSMASTTDTNTAVASACEKEYTLTVTEGSTVTEGFRFGGTGKGQGYQATIKRADGRVIGTKPLPLNESCEWGYDSKPGKGEITYEVRELGASLDTAPLQTIKLNVQ